MKLRPRREPERTIVGYFASIVDAGRAVAAVAAAGLTPSALELVDRHVPAAVDAWKNMGLSADADVVLLARIDTPGAAGDDEAAAMLACFERRGRDVGGAVDRRTRRPTPSSPPAVWPTRPSSGSARCSPRTSASPAPPCPRCSPASRRPAGRHDTHDRQHRPRRRRQPAPAADHPGRRRGRARAGAGGLRRDHRRRPRAGRHRHRRARRRPAQARRPRARALRRSSRCSARSRPRSTRTASSTRARPSERRPAPAPGVLLPDARAAGGPIRCPP